MKNINYSFSEKEVIIQDENLKFDNLRIIKEKGMGANGIVFECFDIVLKRPVALKIWIPRKGRAYPDAKRFEAEIQKLASIQDHESIVKIHYANSHNKFFYAIMEYVEGEVLASWLSKENNTKTKLKVAQRIIRGMDYSHYQNVYHGDLHAQNIIVKSDWASAGRTVKILDFGTSIFSPESSKLRASYLMSQTLAKLFDSEYLELLHPQILEFVHEENWMKVRNKYKNQNFITPESVLACFEVLIEFITAKLEHLGKISDLDTLLSDLCLFLVKSPFLNFEKLIPFLREYANENQIYYFIDQFWRWTNFGGGVDPIHLMSEEFKELLVSMPGTNNAVEAYLHINETLSVNSEQYLIWRDFYKKYISYLQLKSLLV
ncbi:protein kinase [Paenibacillus sp. FSL R5-0486]|uniref:protein kinase domain-containing protein n=1 Tax=Paenibacillus sp. FSL R5-0486 TaxID=2921645 RepID=UPI0030D97349